MTHRSNAVREGLRRSNKQYYSLKDRVVPFYHIPEVNVLMASGQGPRDIIQMYDYQEICTIGRFINRVKHYTIKELGKNFSRMPLELEWFVDSGRYRALTWVPGYINQDLFYVTMNDLYRRLSDLDLDIQLATLPERHCAQLLHVGSYDAIEASIGKMRNILPSMGYEPKGSPQEIDMNHPHCNPPDKLKILIRQEITKVSRTPGD